LTEAQKAYNFYGNSAAAAFSISAAGEGKKLNNANPFFDHHDPFGSPLRLRGSPTAPQTGAHQG
jgi:hypothetical protein